MTSGRILGLTTRWTLVSGKMLISLTGRFKLCEGPGDFYDREDPSEWEVERDSRREQRQRCLAKVREPIATFLPRSRCSPESAREEQSPATREGRVTQGREGTGSTEGESVPEVWWSTDPEPVPGWKIRKVRVCGFLQCADAATKPNTMLWPKLNISVPRGQEAFLF
jgi:hypothetical protein